MKNILIIGAQGQIGSELTSKLRTRYGVDNVISGDLYPPPRGSKLADGPNEVMDITSAVVSGLNAEYALENPTLED